MNDERGDMLTNSLLKLLVFFLVVGLVIFESGAILVNRVQLDEAGNAAARAVAEVAARERSPQRLEEVARDALPSDVELNQVSREGDTIAVQVSRDAAVLILDRLGPLSDWASATVTKEAQLR